jgi:predicted DNA-binding WGR domain protein
MITRRFENTTGNHYKFWEAEYPSSPNEGCQWTVRWGRIGTNGQSKTHQEYSWSDASYQAAKLIAEKLGKGYVEQGSSVAAFIPGSTIGYSTFPAAPAPKVLPKAPAPDPVDEIQRTAILALLEAGHDSDIIAATLRLTRQQVAAVAAHRTMGTYKEPVAADGGNKRAFDWEA